MSAYMNSSKGLITLVLFSEPSVEKIDIIADELP